MFRLYDEEEKCPKLARAAALVWDLYDNKVHAVLDPPFGKKREKGEKFYARLESVKQSYSQIRNLLLHSAGEKEEPEEDRQSAKHILHFLLDIVIPLPGDFWYPKTDFEKEVLAELQEDDEGSIFNKHVKLVLIFAARDKDDYGESTDQSTTEIDGLAEVFWPTILKTFSEIMKDDRLRSVIAKTISDKDDLRQVIIWELVMALIDGVRRYSSHISNIEPGAYIGNHIKKTGQYILRDYLKVANWDEIEPNEEDWNEELREKFSEQNLFTPQSKPLDIEKIAEGIKKIDPEISQDSLDMIKLILQVIEEQVRSGMKPSLRSIESDERIPIRRQRINEYLKDLKNLGDDFEDLIE